MTSAKSIMSTHAVVVDVGEAFADIGYAIAIEVVVVRDGGRPEHVQPEAGRVEEAAGDADPVLDALLDVHVEGIRRSIDAGEPHAALSARTAVVQRKHEARGPAAEIGGRRDVHEQGAAPRRAVLVPDVVGSEEEAAHRVAVVRGAERVAGVREGWDRRAWRRRSRPGLFAAAE